MTKANQVIAVIGGKDIEESDYKEAYTIGQLIAQNGITLVTGGLSGTMEAASKGAYKNNGTVIGILPSLNRNDANEYVTITIPTGMGIARNVLVVNTADVVIAFPGKYGTLSEIGLALNSGKPVICMPGSWNLPKIAMIDRALFKEATSANHAIGMALNFFSNQ